VPAAATRIEPFVTRPTRVARMLWEAHLVATRHSTLMVGHAAGLVTCLTLIKDYKDNPQLKGLGTFIVLFGVGLVIALSAVVAWLFGRADYWVLTSLPLRGGIGSHQSARMRGIPQLAKTARVASGSIASIPGRPC
jgi:hypothetical protein